MPPNDRKNIIIAGGGTGGHIYPGIAIANAFSKEDYQVHFVGTQYGLEKKIVPKANYPLIFIPSGQLNTSNKLKKIVTLFKMPLSLLYSAYVLFRLRPVHVLGVGGYASGPFVLVASFLGFSCSIWEPNATPGLTNRWLSRFVNTGFVVFAEAKKILSCRNVFRFGLPVRKELEQLAKESSSQGPLKILVFGGSQGAKALNDVIIESFKSSASWCQNTEIKLQTGEKDGPRVQEALASYKPVTVQPYIYDMAEAYRWADVVICRAGASTLAELASCGLPSILVPFPYAADNHQYKNAKALEREGAAQVIEQSHLDPSSLGEALSALMSEEERNKMADSVKVFHVENASQKIATKIVELS